jgi:hypothetical protein
MSKHTLKIELNYETEELDISPNKALVAKVDVSRFPPVLRHQYMKQATDALRQMVPNPVIVVTHTTNIESWSIDDIKLFMEYLQEQIIVLEERST